MRATLHYRIRRKRLGYLAQQGAAPLSSVRQVRTLYKAHSAVCCCSSPARAQDMRSACRDKVLAVWRRKREWRSVQQLQRQRESNIHVQDAWRRLARKQSVAVRPLLLLFYTSILLRSCTACGRACAGVQVQRPEPVASGIPAAYRCTGFFSPCPNKCAVSMLLYTDSVDATQTETTSACPHPRAC